VAESDRRLAEKLNVSQRYNRDRCRCRDCGGRGRPVHLHHHRLLSREEGGLSRLLTLCHGCHAEIDRRLAVKLNA
jgi:hypothetical protein